MIKRWLQLAAALPVLALAIYGGLKLASAWRTPEPIIDPARRLQILLDDRITERIAAAIRHDPAASEIYVLPLAGDAGGSLRRLIKEKIAARGLTAVIDNPSDVAKKIRAFEGEKESEDSILAGIRRFLDPDPERPLALEEGIAFARRYRVPAILLGEVRRLDDAERARLEVEARAVKIEPAPGELPLLEKRLFDEDIRKSLLSPVYFRIRMRAASGWTRFFIWLTAALMLPFALYPLVRGALDRESNLSSALLLFGLTAADVLFAWFLVGFALGDGAAMGALAGATAVGFAWNYFTCDRLEEFRR